MVTDLLKQLAAARARVADLEKQAANHVSAELAALPAAYGFADVKSFIKAVKAAVRGKAGAPSRRAAKVSTKRGGRKQRVEVTDALRAEAKALFKAGKTGGEVAAALNVSLPTAQNIKKGLGLVKTR